MHRFIVGLGSGVVSRCIPVYIGEVAAASIRGELVVLTQLMLMVGFLIGFIFGMVFDFHWMGYTSAILVLPYWLAIVLCPESPAWLVRTGQHKQARRSVYLTKGRFYDYDGEVITFLIIST